MVLYLYCTAELKDSSKGKFTEMNVSITWRTGSTDTVKRDKFPIALHHKWALISSLLIKALHIYFI